MSFTFKVDDSGKGHEFIKLIETLDFVKPVHKKSAQKKKNNLIIPAENPKGNPLMLTDAFNHIKNVRKFRNELWQRK